MLLVDRENSVCVVLAQTMSLIMHRNIERNFFLERLSGNMVRGTGCCHCFQNTGRQVGEWLSPRKPSSIFLALAALPYYAKGRVSETGDLPGVAPAGHPSTLGKVKHDPHG